VLLFAPQSEVRAYEHRNSTFHGKNKIVSGVKKVNILQRESNHEEESDKGHLLCNDCNYGLKSDTSCV
jgi:hypothetical protein